MEINALTLATTDMARSVAFYSGVLGLEIAYGGASSDFTTFAFGSNYLNVFVHHATPTFWGRVVLHVDDPDEVWRTLRSAGIATETDPADAPWGERYFHVRDPDGHELSFARPILDTPGRGPA